MVTADQYVATVVAKYSVNNAAGSPAFGAAMALGPTLTGWANRFLLNFGFSGSFAKGTAISLGTDVDVFLSVSDIPGRNMKEIYWGLFNYLAERQLQPEAQNVSVKVRSKGLCVDVVPGRRQAGNTTDHTLYRRKADTWTQTNVAQHVKLISSSGRTSEIRAVKIWRQLNGLDFPSFYLELTTLEALKGRRPGQLADNTLMVLKYLADRLTLARVVDPANTNNVISDDLDYAGKKVVADTAAKSAAQGSWGQIIW